MYRYECHNCHGLCDPAELENGVCFECRKTAVEHKEQHELKIRKELNRLMQARYREQADGQMVMHYGAS